MFRASTSIIDFTSCGFMQNPIARWHVCQGSINSIAFSSDGTYIATVGRDGIVFLSFVASVWPFPCPFFNLFLVVSDT